MKALVQIYYLIVLASTCAISQVKKIDRIIAKVGSEIVLYSDWQEQIAFIKDKQTNVNESDYCSILENILVQKFMVHQAKLDSVEVKDEEIENQLSSRIDQILQYMGNDTKKFEEYYGQTVAEVRNRFKEDLKAQLLSEKLQNKIVGNVTITPKETETFYKSIPKDSVPYFSSEVEIREIVIKPIPSQVEIDNAKEKLNKILQKIKNGESFEKQASIYSDDLASGKQGGNLGWMKRGTLVPEYEAVAYKLEQDSISGIVETEFGYHIIQLLGRRGNSINTRHILIKSKISDEDNAASRKEIEDLRAKMLKDSIPFEQMVRKYSDKKAETYNFGGQLVNQKTGNSYFEIADLDPDVYFAVDNIKVGEISNVVESTDPEGKKYYRIFKLISRTSPHKANLLQDYAKIQQAAKELKKNEIFRKWLNVHVPKIYSDIDQDLVQQCPSLSIWSNNSKKG
ncbi:MAG: peptidylprolyl isomerase [Saprospiraceae bacterium]